MWVHFPVSDHNEFNIMSENRKPTWEQTGSVCTISSKPVGPYTLSERLLAGFQYGVSMAYIMWFNFGQNWYTVYLQILSFLFFLPMARCQIMCKQNDWSSLWKSHLIHAVIKGLSLFTRCVDHVQQDFHIPWFYFGKFTYSHLLPFHSWFCDSSLSSLETASSFLMTYIQ